MIDFLWKNFFQTEKQSIYNFLQNQPLFSTLSVKEIRLIERIVYHRSYFPGEVIFKPSSNIGMYMIMQGQVHISYEDKSQEDPLILSRLKEGDFFGELSLVQEKGYQKITAVATEASDIYGFFRPELLQLTIKHPKIGCKIMMKLSEILGIRLQKAGEQLATHSS